jgi:hypothetical protein
MEVEGWKKFKSFIHLNNNNWFFFGNKNFVGTYSTVYRERPSQALGLDSLWSFPSVCTMGLAPGFALLHMAGV